MTPDALRALQAPLKDRYKADPKTALAETVATGTLDQDRLACIIARNPALARQDVVEAGLHPTTGGDGSQACSGDMLLEALVACAGVTLLAVATSMGLAVKGTVTARSSFDARGTLAIDRTAPVGLGPITLTFALVTAADAAQIQRLLTATERYCVIAQTLRASTPVTLAMA